MMKQMRKQTRKQMSAENNLYFDCWMRFVGPGQIMAFRSV